MDLSTPVTQLPLIGPTYARRLKRLQIETAEDLLFHFPFRYNDLRLTSTIAQVQAGETVTIKGTIISAQNIYTTRGKRIQKAIIADPSGQIEATWFNQPYLTKTFKQGRPVALSGPVKRFGAKLSLTSPEYELLNHQRSTFKDQIHTGRLVPVYPETRGLSSKWLRSRIAPLLKSALPQLYDYLPEKIQKKHQLISLSQALKKIHFPKNFTDIKLAKKRLGFDELFLLHLASEKRHQDWQQHQVSHAFHIDQEKVLNFISNLPFKLTSAQKRVVKEITSDLAKPIPMNRLLEGDVGSGKTVVAAIATYIAFLNGLQTALMAPTQILAHQHSNTLKTLLEPPGIKINLYTGASKKKPAQTADLLLGTHSLLHQPQAFTNLGLVIIDEQHRFGVEQRASLARQGKAPHILTMTATPIPRTIALTLYGDLDFSVIDEMPPGRKATKTWVVPPQKRATAYDWIKKQILKQNHQVFVICPLIEVSEKESMKQVRAATAEFDRLKSTVFPDLKLKLLHGRIKAKEKNTILKEFAQGKFHLLVATPVVEVGIDIPNANLMVIEAAERFGLAQLHQLRGRIGRRGKQSYCLLFTDLKAPKVIRRLKSLEQTNSGLKLAEIDLKLRGPGEVYGTAQHGFINLKIASFSDLKLINATKKAAHQLILKNPQLKKYPQLAQKLKTQLAKVIEPN
jgi:ATP-dependent DNA helicase RecG